MAIDDVGLEETCIKLSGVARERRWMTKVESRVSGKLAGSTDFRYREFWGAKINCSSNAF